MSKKLVTALYRVSPNPNHTGRIKIEFSIAQPSQMSLRIFNPSGRLVKTVRDGFIPNGVYNLTWDGKDQNNQTVTSGIYFVMLDTQKERLK